MPRRFIPAIATQSVGRVPHHPLPHRLHQIASQGFCAVEIFYEDLAHYASTLSSSTSSATDSTPTTKQLLTAAEQISSLCHRLDLSILCLQPFTNYDGLTSSTAHAQRLTELHLWIRLAHLLHTDLIQIPSSFLPTSQCTSSRTAIISSLRQAADIGHAATPPIRFAYEALCFGTHISTWESAYSIVCSVDRPNLGMCLDTFNLLGRVYGDPASPTGLNPNAEADTNASLARLRNVDVSKIFYVEACDGGRLAEPLVEGHKWYKPDQKARMSWSRNARLWPCEEEEFGGYLPVEAALKAVIDAGYQGYVAFEVFNERGYDEEEGVPRELSERAWRSWVELERRMGWNKYDGGEEEKEQQQQPKRVERRTRKDSGVGSETEAEAEGAVGLKKLERKTIQHSVMNASWQQAWETVEGKFIAPRI